MTKYENRNICKLAKKLKSINYLGGKCKECGETNIFKMSFHHIDPLKKEINFNDYRWTRWSVTKKELDKCDLLCQNCHRKIHFNQSKVDKNHIRRIGKLILIEYAGGKCVKCGYNECPSSLTFHHKEKSSKLFSIGSHGNYAKSIQEINDDLQNEIDKCILLCMNCHTLEHSNIEFYEKYKDLIVEKSLNYKEKQGKLDREKIISLYVNGVSQIEISKIFSASKGTISDIIKKYKIKIPKGVDPGIHKALMDPNNFVISKEAESDYLRHASGIDDLE